jgi:lipoprotein-anchoring transpeptidase ErfK/SrfK
MNIKALAPSKPRIAAVTGPGGRLEEGKVALARGDFIEGRRLLSQALVAGLTPADQEVARAELTRLSQALLFSRATNTNDPLTSVHTIGPGDTLHGLAARQKVTEELLASINKVAEANHLRVGQRIKLINGPFRAVIEKANHRMDVYLGDIFVRSLPVGLGADGYTPTGEWIVNNKLRNPDWRDPVTNRHYLADDPDNPIGERWIGLSGISGNAVGKTGFGIHGTIDLTSIGGDKSMGCVRLKPDDVNLVYDLLVLNDSHVIIRN